MRYYVQTTTDGHYAVLDTRDRGPDGSLRRVCSEHSLARATVVCAQLNRDDAHTQPPRVNALF